MIRKLALTIPFLFGAMAWTQTVNFIPPPVAGYLSSTGSSLGPWQPITGSGGTAVSFIPNAAALYYSTDGTGHLGTWAPCTSACFGGGGYTLPIAQPTTLGGIKPDNTTITVNASTGVASASGGGTPASPASSEQYNKAGAFGGTTTIYIPPSGSDDSAAINAAWPNGLVHLATAPCSAPYIINSGVVIGGSGGTIRGEGQGQTCIKHTSATATAFKLNWATAASALDPSPTKGGGLADFEILQDSGVTATAGAGIQIGTGSNNPYTSNFSVERIAIFNVYNAIEVDTGSYIGWFNQIFANDLTHTCIYYNDATSGGDVNLDNISCRGTNGTSGVIEGLGDVHEYTNLKINGSQFVFARTGFNYYGQLHTPDFEGDFSTTTCGIDFGTGGTAPVGWQIWGGEIDAQTTTICNLTTNEMNGCYNSRPIGTTNPTLTCIGTSNIAATGATGSTALATSAISSGVCQSVTPGSVNSSVATGATATNKLLWSPGPSLQGVAGYQVSTSGALSIDHYLTSGYVNFNVCNWTASPITPGALTLYWSVLP